MKARKEKIIDVAKTEIGQRFIKMINNGCLNISDDEVDKLIRDNNLANDFIDFENGANNDFDKKMDHICDIYIKKKQKIIVDSFIKEEYNRILDDYNDKKFNKKEMNHQMNIVVAIEKAHEPRVDK